MRLALYITNFELASNFDFFLEGLPNGRCSVLFTNGESSEMYFKDGYVDGKVRHFNSDGQLQFVGVYRQGLPHGPVWIFPWIFEEEGAVLVSSFTLDKQMLGQENLYEGESDPAFVKPSKMWLLV